MLESELALARVTGISLAEHSVSVSGHNTSGVESLPHGLSELLVGDLLASELLLQFHDPCEHFLVGKSVEGSSESVKTSGEGEVGIGESASDKVGGVCRNVSSLVVAVDDEVKAHELIEGWVVEAELAGEVCGPVELGVVWHELALLVGVLVDHTSNTGQLG